MKTHLLSIFLLLAPVAYSQLNLDFQLSGTAINTTNADPVAAPAKIIVQNGGCKLIVSLPLVGSGNCLIKGFDRNTKHIEIVSFGPPTITWTGVLKGNLASGTYKVEVGSQTGTFYFALLKRTDEELVAPPAIVQRAVPYSPHFGSCVPAIESAISGEVHGWDGETIFKLDNGQIWQQAEYDYNYFYDYNPDVTIYQTSGGCRMKVEGENETLPVKRIK